MRYHIENKIYHVEILPPKQSTEKLEADLELFAEKYNRVMESGYCACITDNAMGLLAFQGHEIINELNLKVNPEQVMIHLNTFHTKSNLCEILDTCMAKGIKYLLIISGDGSDRLPKLQPADVEAEDVQSVTSVELLRYIKRHYPDTFTLGVAFNPYEPPEHEFEKLKRKIDAGAEFIVTQPIIEKNAIVDEMIQKYPDIPVIVEAWMSKKLYLLSDAVGYPIPEDTEFDPIKTLMQIHRDYPNCGVYLSLLGFKTQYHLIGETWRNI
ncbi:MAG: bifunctional homocysteine S-methyltransferase/5,10-methylenetetrahydrofolate reductase protein [Firmicutes bacterium ADurb.Bin193]|nr:MAG: bifunctional homocysteine S-methyltransferase/5,10-methylenetetrahydrofolate reductase protein [Firmicutes bacterium ADurb.Bin193]